MKTIKIKFINFWTKFDENNNFIINILKKYYEVKISSEPEYLFYCGFTADIYDYKCIRISYSFENLTPDFNLCDYAVGFDYIYFGDRYLRYPLYLVSDFCYYKNDNYKNDLNLALSKHNFTSKDFNNKIGFCSFVVSSPVDPIRNKFFKDLSKYKEVASGGRFMNNVGRLVDDKLEFQSRYKFSIAFENSSSPGYTTEKLLQAFASKTIPIYYGNPKIGVEFNTKAFINCMDYKNLDDVIDRIKEIDDDDKLYMQMMKEKAFNQNPGLFGKDLDLFLRGVIDQPVELAYRRNRSDYGKKYEKKYRISTKYYNKLYNIYKYMPLKKLLKKL